MSIPPEPESDAPAWGAHDYYVLSEQDYDSLVVCGLMRNGVPEAEAVRFAASRWPLSYLDVINECHARGVLLSEQDLTDFLVQSYGHLVDDVEVSAPRLAWPAFLVNKLLDWVAHQNPPRGTPVHEMPAGDLNRETLFRMLRTGTSVDRLVAGKMLAASLGAGMAARKEATEDVEFILSPALGHLVARSIAGDLDACDQLEKLIETREAPLILARARRVDDGS
jgi:hypothetical protein